MGRNGRAGDAFDFGFAAAVYAGWAVWLGPVYAFSGGLAVRVDRIVVCDFGIGVASLSQESMACEGAVFVEVAAARNLGSFAI